jgi:hypothetical protein
LTQLGQQVEIEDWFSWFEYPHGSVCRVRIYSEHSMGNILLRLDAFSGKKTNATLMVMNRDVF